MFVELDTGSVYQMWIKPLELGQVCPIVQYLPQGQLILQMRLPDLGLGDTMTNWLVSMASRCRISVSENGSESSKRQC